MHALINQFEGGRPRIINATLRFSASSSCCCCRCLDACMHGMSFFCCCYLLLLLSMLACCCLNQLTGILFASLRRRSDHLYVARRTQIAARLPIVCCLHALAV
ncbi:hypothetical protein BS78_05G290500 [Paspalum vaginatum]|nr:hypothetical protein BS78_05G290500 [Paspalum vaginatum]